MPTHFPYTNRKLKRTFAWVPNHSAEMDSKLHTLQFDSCWARARMRQEKGCSFIRQHYSNSNYLRLHAHNTADIPPCHPPKPSPPHPTHTHAVRHGHVHSVCCHTRFVYQGSGSGGAGQTIKRSSLCGKPHRWCGHHHYF